MGVVGLTIETVVPPPIGALVFLVYDGMNRVAGKFPYFATRFGSTQPVSSRRTLLLVLTDSLELMPVTGERPRSPMRMKMGELLTFLITMSLITTSRISAPSTDSTAKPRDRSKRMFLIVTVLKPLVPSVPNFTRAVGPSRSVATSFCTE